MSGLYLNLYLKAGYAALQQIDLPLSPGDGFKLCHPAPLSYESCVPSLP